MQTRYLVTGGAGFIGSTFVRHLLETNPRTSVVNLDALTYAGVQASVAELDALGRHRFVHGDIRDEALVDDLMTQTDVVVHFAAESHVDRSIDQPSRFLETNVVGTGVLLAAAHRHDVPRFIHVSTDEVYGSFETGFAKEGEILRPSSPYAASKAASDLLALSYASTYGYKAIVTRCTNNYGPYQFPEKVIPLFITNVLSNRKVPLYGNGLNERDWIHVDDHCAALIRLIEEGRPGEVYNIGAQSQVTNMELTRRLLSALDRDSSWIEWVPDRPGHDLRYAVDTSKIQKLGWAPRISLDQGLLSTIDWYIDHEEWWRPLKEAS